MAKDERAERLAAALRENLKRRKAQARQVDEGEDMPAPPPSDERA
ncbi:hypothetical protein [Sphingomonas sp. PB1R3]